MGFSILPHLLCCVRGKASEGRSRALHGTPTALLLLLPQPCAGHAVQSSVFSPHWVTVTPRMGDRDLCSPLERSQVVHSNVILLPRLRTGAQGRLEWVGTLAPRFGCCSALCPQDLGILWELLDSAASQPKHPWEGCGAPQVMFSSSHLPVPASQQSNPSSPFHLRGSGGRSSA